MRHLRQRMLDELQRLNYSQSTVRCYFHAVKDFAKYFHRSPERLGPEHICVPRASDLLQMAIEIAPAETTSLNPASSIGAVPTGI